MFKFFGKRKHDDSRATRLTELLEDLSTAAYVAPGFGPQVWDLNDHTR